MSAINSQIQNQEKKKKKDKSKQVTVTAYRQKYYKAVVRKIPAFMKDH